MSTYAAILVLQLYSFNHSKVLPLFLICSLLLTSMRAASLVVRVRAATVVSALCLM